MLVLSSQVGESVLIGDRITLKVLEVQGRQVCLGIDAPEDHLPTRAGLDELWLDEKSITESFASAGYELASSM